MKRIIERSSTMKKLYETAMINRGGREGEIEALKLAEKAHDYCPYSKATKGNIDVEVTVV